jgi:hypothetical protein
MLLFVIICTQPRNMYHCVPRCYRTLRPQYTLFSSIFRNTRLFHRFTAHEHEKSNELAFLVRDVLTIAKDVTQARNLINVAPLEKITDEILESIINTYAEQHNATEITSFLQQLGEKQIRANLLRNDDQRNIQKPSISLVNTIIKAYCSMDQFRTGNHILRRAGEMGITPNENTFITMIEQLARSGNFKHVKYVYENLLPQYSIKPNGALNVAYLNAHLKCGKVTDNVHSAKDADKPVSEYNTMIADLFLKKNVQEAEELFKTMKGKGKIDSRTIIAFMMGYRQIKQYRKGIYMFNEFQANGIQPHDGAKKILLSLYCSLGDILRADNVFSMIRVKMGDDYMQMIKMYIRKRNYDQANALLEKIRERIDIDIIDDLIKTHLFVNDVEAAKQLFDRMETVYKILPRAQTHMLFVRYWAVRKQYDIAEKSLFEMVDKGLNPTPFMNLLNTVYTSTGQKFRFKDVKRKLGKHFWIERTFGNAENQENKK